MNKLKNKVFFTIFSILTISIISLIVIFNIQNYISQKKSIINSLNVATNNDKNPKDMEPISKPEEEPKPLDENIKFMDYNIYTILLDSNDNIKDIINHSNNKVSNSDISAIAKDILNNKNIKNKYIGCLYFEDYSYAYVRGNVLVILDNSDIKTSLLKSLESTFLIFIFSETIIFLISKLITEWITKPVRESFEKQKQFIADASHELKTPLSVILASSEAFEDNPKEKKWLINIKEEANRMNLLITDLLELAKTEQKNINLKDGDLSKVVELSTLTFEGKAFENNIKIDYDIAPNIKIKMSENSIKQLVEILLDNAVKHSIEKSTINISLREDSNQVELLVKNKGDRIPKGEEEKIFERFYRVDKARNRDSNRYGLGLAIAKNIVLNHNGKISAYSSDDTTTFKVLFKK